jgi:4-amino-4-deoxy-L-arabinose transferase-like glycosyltransferase
LSSIWPILAVAIILRVWFAWNYIHVRPEHALGVIPFLFEPGNIAHSLATGRGFGSPFLLDTGPTAWMTPVYPAILSGIFHLFGIFSYHAFLAAVAFNIICASLICLPIFRIGARVGGVLVGAVAAWLWAVFPNAILIPVESMWDSCLSALLLTLILWSTLALAESRSTRSWLGYGLLWGLALMTNPTLGSVLPIFVVWAGLRSQVTGISSAEKGWTNLERIKRPALSVAVALLCCVPWTIRNYEVFHTFIPLRSAMGISLWLGNNDNTEQLTVGHMHPISSSVERDRYVELGEPAYMRMKKDEALRFITSHPGTAMRFTADRFVSFWSGDTAHPVDDFLRQKSLWFRYILLFNFAAGMGCLSGIVALVRLRDLKALLLGSLPIIFPCVYYLTVVTPRYRLPVDPVVLLLTAVAIDALFRPRSSDRILVPVHTSSQAKGVEACV